MTTGLRRLVSRIAGGLGRERWWIRRLRPLYEWGLLALSRGRGIEWDINGEPFRIDPRYRHRLGHLYDAPVAGYLRARVRPGHVCLDVGANVGVYVLQFGRWARPGGRVVAFEPNPWARAVLDRHIRMNDLTSITTVAPFAVGAETATADLFIHGADGRGRLGRRNPELTRGSPHPVSVVTLDEYCAQHGIVPDWLFIDIEGYELTALQGARRLIVKRGAALGIVVELHPNVWEDADTTADAFRAFLRAAGRDLLPLTGQTDPLEQHGLVALVP